MAEQGSNAGQEGQQGQGDQGQQGQQTGQSQQQAPALDPKVIQGVVAEAFKTEFDKFRTDAGSRQTQQQQQYQPPEDPMARIIAPVVGPALQSVALQAQAAMDAATFYGGGANAADPHDDFELKTIWRSDIENKFQELVRNGAPVPRADILSWMIGGPKRREYMEWATKRNAEATQRAQFAQTAGGGQMRMGTGGTSKSVDQMTEEELLQQLSQGF